MGQAQPWRADGADEGRDRAQRRGSRRAGAAELHRLRYVVNGTLNRTIRPLMRSRAASSSSYECTTMTSPSTPSAGVPTLLPRPSMISGRRWGSVISALSWPLTQCGTFTGSVCTFSRPSFFISSTAHRIASSSGCDPLRRLPKRIAEEREPLPREPRRCGFGDQFGGRFAIGIEPRRRAAGRGGWRLGGGCGRTATEGGCRWRAAASAHLTILSAPHVEVAARPRRT